MQKNDSLSAAQNSRYLHGRSQKLKPTYFISPADREQRLFERD